MPPSPPTSAKATVEKSNPLTEMFPDLYYDEKTVVEKTLKATPPSIAQVMAKVLTVNGINNNSLASELGRAAEAYYKGA